MPRPGFKPEWVLLAAAGGIALCAVAGLLTMSGGFWSTAVTKFTESGFV